MKDMLTTRERALPTTEFAVAEMFDSSSGAWEPSGAGRWELRGETAGTVPPLVASRRGEWLRFQVDVPRAPPVAGEPQGSEVESALGLLERTAGLRGSAKWAISSLNGSVRVVADVGLPDRPESLLVRAREAIGGIAQALGNPGAGSRSPWQLTTPGPADTLAEPPPADGSLPLRERIAECGWRPREREEGRVDVDLETTPEAPFSEATVERRAGDGGGLRVRVELLRVAASLPGGVCQEALSLLLLRLNAVLRSVRATATRDSGDLVFALEAWLPADASAQELDRALGAASLGVRLCSEELRVLQVESLAREYLAVQGATR